MCIKWGKLAPRISMFQMVYARAGCYHLNCLLYIIDDLSQNLAVCKSGCYIDDQCMNYVMYADHI